MIPVRCFTCNKLLGNLYYIKEWDEETFNKLKIKRFCCKKILRFSIDVHKDLKFSSDTNVYQCKNTIEMKRFVIPR